MAHTRIINGMTFITRSADEVIIKGNGDLQSNVVQVSLDTLLEYVGSEIQRKIIGQIEGMTGKQVLSNLTTLFKEEK